MKNLMMKTILWTPVILMKTCGRGREEREAARAHPRGLKRERATCSLCNTNQSKSNMSRHQNSQACRIMREANL